MPHYASRRFWDAYNALPPEIQELANKCYELLEQNPDHPSLRLKKVGRLWSVRVGRDHRAVAVAIDDGFRWVWIGTHAEYDRLIAKS